MIVLGLDPGFASFGWCAVKLHADGEDPVALGVIRTGASPKKRKVLAREDNWRRAQDLTKALIDVFDGWGPTVVCAEAMSFPRSAASAAKVAMSWGIVATLCEQRKVAVLQPTPQEVKRAVLGQRPKPKRGGRKAHEKKKKGKAATQAALIRRYPRLRRLLRGIDARSQWEHPVDALGAVVACFDSEEIRLFRKLVYQKRSD